MTQKYTTVMAACALLLFVGCANQWLRQPEIIEAQQEQVTGCEQVGTMNELADPGKIIRSLDRYRMEKKIRTQALELGATHIVWHYRSAEAAAATAFRCSP